eukprot:TRINITY_DN4603_c0_g2_i1.p1 TRINITY_DN4603_c0_g2~~TRINITY_DN4603_c0_g2_i1.p1  ORF type:complete len:376 (+),score=72.35 TRINITY_DN4603_c0_g2_i1:74-1201(+)
MRHHSVTIFLFVVLSVCLAASALPRWNQLTGYTFKDYVRDFRRHYKSNEYNYREQIFNERLENIKKHNQDGTKSWKKGVNQFSDLTDEEFRRYLGYNKQWKFSTQPTNQVELTMIEKPLNVLPDSVDWRDNGIITAVKNQGQCGSCWAFGTVESVESYWALATGRLQDLSIQQILDCTANPDDCGGFGGCNGGTAELAFDQLVNQGGLSAEWTYPYKSFYGFNETCDFNETITPPEAVLTGYTKLDTNSYSQVMNAIAYNGPLAINVDASAWSDYESGIFNGCNVTNPDIDHVVQLVGYGNDPNGDAYWLVRNSWSPDWGEDGYVKLPRASDAPCGVDIFPQDGTGCNNGPANVTVCGACGILYDTSFPLVAPPS